MKIENNIEEQRFKRQFSQELKRSIFEAGFDSLADYFLREKMGEYGLALIWQWLDAFFLEITENESLLSRLLYTLSHIHREEVYPQGFWIVLVSLEHENNETQEAAVRCVENWHYIQALSSLKKLEMQDRYVQQYVERVIFDLQMRKTLLQTGDFSYFDADQKRELDLICSCFKDGLLSIGQCAAICGVGIEDMMKYFAGRGIPIVTEF